MALVMMGSEEEEPIFHDFLGMSCSDSPAPVPIMAGGNNTGSGVSSHVEREATMGIVQQVLVCGASDLGSERRGVNNSEVFHFHGRKNTFIGPDSSYTFSGKKRSASDSASLGLIIEKVSPTVSDSHEYSRMMKSFGKEAMSERSGTSIDDEMLVSVQLPPRPMSLVLQSPGASRPVSYMTKWERPVPLHPNQLMHYPSHFGQSGSYMEKPASSCVSRDASSSVMLISQAAADEGSRTGINSSRVLEALNPTGGTNDRSSTGVFPSNSSGKTTQIREPESSDLPSRQCVASVGRQMTIFYGGHVHVFDDVHPNKADVIMALAGSNGGSWLTTYSPTSIPHPIITEVRVPRTAKETRDSNKELYLRGNPVHLDEEITRNPVTGGHLARRVDTNLMTSAELEFQGEKRAR